MVSFSSISSAVFECTVAKGINTSDRGEFFLHIYEDSDIRIVCVVSYPSQTSSEMNYQFDLKQNLSRIQLRILEKRISD